MSSWLIAIGITIMIAAVAAIGIVLYLAWQMFKSDMYSKW